MFRIEGVMLGRNVFWDGSNWTLDINKAYKFSTSDEAWTIVSELRENCLSMNIVYCITLANC